ncbi:MULTISPECIES: TRZ/ATZ family hydrolase [Methylococcus]|jgi:5-methylthioadenosine/S-adenosylhomocysteine deaminase|uniref:5-methylthioadenosine/S-adenosylhomocysteine deaminase n=2 Tax=Methylococcus capsulatus TaxID=414 RepID=Q609G1_METCA|nr:TRZ/ATZ family hydrolase [Methylococcus capsulatus]AAU92427.1 chlorohydrolase family protein [Methylococcus capsulatus str. Bath]QXP88006.1 TRZ/ATZ family hydrolase [Methylococcus capsulatus]QXP90641.1 TRZ/ATZ family hydrolase [Methylococcus capsulatus]QXP94981.1 TRZ/ATZ family hydrolase [Methylococcus capsulatus]UQN13033.1 TRZ/ATZ family hydrolase [Methylococcus capsulatus]
MIIDTLITARWIIPVEPDGVTLEHHALAIDRGRITDLLPTTEALVRYQPRRIERLEHHALIPGLVNAHTHAAMTLLRGVADDLPLMQWLQEHIWPLEQKWIGEAFVRDGVQLAMAEMIRGGVTCFNDMYFFPEVVAREAVRAGMRAAVGMIVVDFPTAWATDADDYLRKGLALRDDYRHEPLIATVFAPHAPYTVSDEPLVRIRTWSEELDCPVHIHLHETADEIHRSGRQYGMRPLKRLDQLGLVGPHLIGVHMTQLEDGEIARLAETGASVVHCPESNLKLASGFCPAVKLLAAGVNVALGTDGAASNNDLDLLGETRTAALLAKAVANDAAALPAHQALRMATLNGAAALGLGAETGSLVVGKSADVVAIGLEHIESLPIYNPVSDLVYAAGRQQVTDVWVAGRQLLKKRELLTLDATEIREKTLIWRDKLIHHS